MARTLLHHAGRVLGIGRLAVTLTFTCACGHRRSDRGSISSPVHKACNAAKAANHVRWVLGGGAEQVSSTMDSISLSLTLSLSLSLNLPLLPRLSGMRADIVSEQCSRQSSSHYHFSSSVDDQDLRPGPLSLSLFLPPSHCSCPQGSCLYGACLHERATSCRGD